MEWPASFYAFRRGDGCPTCAEGRPSETEWGVRFFSGTVSDAYLVRSGIQRGYAIVVWRGRHVAEPTELADDESAAYWLELMRVGRSLDAYLNPVKLNYELFGNEVPHLHTHVLPRYADDPRPGWPFPFPEGDPAPHPPDELRRDVVALQALSAP